MGGCKMYKLIIIDDEEKIASGMAQLFPWQNIGFEVVQVFTSARKALQYIAENPVDVVLTDIEMPDMNGLELSHRLMEYPNIQKIFFSSYSNYEYFRAALQNGVADYLMKPVAYSALLECFEKVKARLDARSAVQETAPKAYYDQIVYDVQQYLKDNYRTATLEEAAAKVSLSPAYLSRVFKEKAEPVFRSCCSRRGWKKHVRCWRISTIKATILPIMSGTITPKTSPVRSKRIMGRAHRNTANPAWMVPRYEGNEAEVLFEAHVELCGGHADPGAAAGGRYHLHDLCDPDAPYDAGQ